MKTIGAIIALLAIMLACTPKETLDPCQEANGTVERNGISMCSLVGQAAIINVNQPGHQALLSFSIYANRVPEGLRLSMEIDLPETGIETSKAYPITAGSFAEQEPITSGTVTFQQIRGNYWEGTYEAVTALGNRSNTFSNGHFKSNFDILD